MSMLLIRYDICDCGVAKWYYSIPDLTLRFNTYFEKAQGSEYLGLVLRLKCGTILYILEVSESKIFCLLLLLKYRIFWYFGWIMKLFIPIFNY